MTKTKQAPTPAPVPTNIERGFNFQRVPIASLVERSSNPNVMAASQEAALMASIAKSGFLQPVLVRYRPTGLEIIDGVHRVRAAQALGYTEVPCVVVESDEAEAILLQVGLNKMRGELDLHGVAVLLGELANEGITQLDMELTGYSATEVGDLLSTLTTTHPDELPKGPVGGQEGPENAPEEDPTQTYPLEVVFARKKDLQAVKRFLKKKGGGDMAMGLLAILEEVE